MHPRDVYCLVKKKIMIIKKEKEKGPHRLIERYINLSLKVEIKAETKKKGEGKMGKKRRGDLYIYVVIFCFAISLISSAIISAL